LATQKWEGPVPPPPLQRHPRPQENPPVEKGLKTSGGGRLICEAKGKIWRGGITLWKKGRGGGQKSRMD